MCRHSAIQCVCICLSRNERYLVRACTLVELNCLAWGCTTWNSCLPIAEAVLTSTRTVLWSPTPLWKESCIVDVISNSGKNHTLSIGSVPLTYVCSSELPQFAWVASCRPMFSRYFASPPHRTCSFISMNMSRQSPSCCQTCSCAIKSAMDRHDGDRSTPLVWI